ncbi:hypothetical protein QFC20_001804 [Naganishia adeliensis]|uniref:Uncharacterized protein n=1 Tax=Naganishia adeliensis TaxID=92952 RepID=A0ACC2WQR9_9TREE|nr:hypothetical protein QFC20_001804 [Naganishia adeliensis]
MSHRDTHDLEGRPERRDRDDRRRADDRRDRDEPRRRDRSRDRERARDGERGGEGERERERIEDRPSDEDRDRRRRKREKRRKEEKRAKKDRKREKKEKKRLKKTSAVTSQWGTYGIIDTSDQHNKEPEFRAWLVEERHVNPETLAKDKERKEFARFVEDYNTATLPHEKYYDMEKYEIKMRLIRGGEAVPDAAGGYDPNADLAAHSNSLKRAPVETESFLNKSQVEELRRLQQERAEVGQRKVLGISVPKNMGIRHEEKNQLYR